MARGGGIKPGTSTTTAENRNAAPDPSATRLFISGPPRSRAGMPVVKNRRPGPARTAAVRIICIHNSDAVPTVACSQ